jgi:gluconate 2-dehydrogenase gamma chain
MTTQSRRSFLVGSALGLSAGWVASNWAGILDAKDYAADAAAAETRKFAFFTDEQAADIDAIASRIIPTDESPGAHEAGCVYFIDCALTTFMRDSQTLYSDGLKELKAKTKESFPGAVAFAALSSPQQIQLLTAIEGTPFFTSVRVLTITGMFASPAHGGNRDQVGWKLLGFDDTLNFEPPFGFYDAATEPW